MPQLRQAENVKRLRDRILATMPEHVRAAYPDYSRPQPLRPSVTGEQAQLQPADILLSRERIVTALAAAGMDEGLAEQWQHGAIRWRSVTDKQGIERITPISMPARKEIERYLVISRRAGNVPLFPSVRDVGKAVPRAVAERWLARAERLAGQAKLRGGLFHPYRRLWATERKHLADVDVAEAGGWTGTKAMKLAYQSATPAGVLAAIEVAS